MITKKEALRLLEKKFGKSRFVGPLCVHMPVQLWENWYDYWMKINIDRHASVLNYFEFYPTNKELSLLRLLVAHQFIEETYHD